jgi:hypothetical protein
VCVAAVLSVVVPQQPAPGERGSDNQLGHDHEDQRPTRRQSPPGR